MGTLTVSAIVTRAQKTLYDETGVQWPLTELYDYAAAAINAIVANKPDVYVQSKDVTLVEDTKQEIPSSGIQLIDVVRNTSGGQIRQIDRNHFDHLDIDWHTVTGDKVQHFSHDKRDPRRYYVYPKPAGPRSAGGGCLCGSPASCERPERPGP